MRLSVMCPYGPEEKQALLEAEDLRSRAEVLVALAEIDLAIERQQRHDAAIARLECSQG